LALRRSKRKNFRSQDAREPSVQANRPDASTIRAKIDAERPASSGAERKRSKRRASGLFRRRAKAAKNAERPASSAAERKRSKRRASKFDVALKKRDVVKESNDKASKKQKRAIVKKTTRQRTRRR